MGHVQTDNVASLPFQASLRDGKSFYRYFPMPFADGMRMTIESECEDEDEVRLDEVRFYLRRRPRGA